MTTIKPPLRRRIRNCWQALKQRLGDAWQALRSPHYIIYFDNGRGIPEDGRARGMNGGWRGLRRQDLYDVGCWCSEMLAEDDECLGLVDDVNDLLGN